LPQAPFLHGKIVFSEKVIFLILRKNVFLMIKNTTFELLDHHHELNQKKNDVKGFFMFKIDSTMLKL